MLEKDELAYSGPSRNVLVPNGGYVAKRPWEGKDVLTRRFWRHYHNLYGYMGDRAGYSKLLTSPVDFFQHTPYWVISSSWIVSQGSLSKDRGHLHLGLLDHINLFQTLSILAIAAHSRLDKLAENTNDDALGYLLAALYRSLEFAVDVAIRFPAGVAATLTNHAFDAVKWIASIAIALVTATVFQLGAELGYAALAGYNAAYKAMPDVKMPSFSFSSFFGKSADEASPLVDPNQKPEEREEDFGNVLYAGQ